MMMKMNEERTYKMELTSEQVEWVINRDKILDYIYMNRDRKWMPYIFPDEVYRTGDTYRESVWLEIKKQAEL